MKRPLNSLKRKNLRLAKIRWPGGAERLNLEALRSLSDHFRLSIALGDLILLDGRWYVTHAGLLRLAHRNRCSGIRVQPLREFCDAAASRWVFKATVYKSAHSKGFVGYGDAEPSNVSSLVRGAEMRVARDPGGQPGPAQGLWHRAVLGGGAGVLGCSGREYSHKRESSGSREGHSQQRPAPVARPPLPTDSPVPTRPHSG